jgi:rhodanese-related sulfurtransferase
MPMPREVDREFVRRLLGGDVQIVEVLGAEEYEEWHLPGALNLPLRRIEAEARNILDPAHGVVVYCWDMA